MKKILSYSIPMVLAGLLLWYAYKDVDFDKMLQDMQKGHLNPILITFLTTFVAHVARALRWNLLFQPLGYHPSSINSFLAVMSGYFANLIIPRAGEVSRCTALFTSEKIPVQISIGSVIAERGLDFVVFGILTLLAFSLEYQKLINFVADVSAKLGIGSESGSNLKWIILGTFGFIALLAYLFRKSLSSIPIVVKLFDLAAGFMDGLLSVTKLEKPVLFVFFTVLIWTCYFLTTYFSLLIFDFSSDLGFKAAFLLLVIGSFGIILPVPGAVGGPFQAFVSSALVILYLKDESLSVTAATTMYYSQQLFTVVLGGICYLATVILANKSISSQENGV